MQGYGTVVNRIKPLREDLKTRRQRIIEELINISGHTVTRDGFTFSLKERTKKPGLSEKNLKRWLQEYDSNTSEDIWNHIQDAREGASEKKQSLHIKPSST
jgi:hypothetical protein